MRKIFLMLFISGGIYTSVFAQQFTKVVFDSLVLVNSSKSKNEQICVVLLDSNFQRYDKNIFCPDSTLHDVSIVRDELFEKLKSNENQFVYFSVWGRTDIMDYISPINPVFKRSYNVTYHRKNTWPEILNGNMKISDKKNNLLCDLNFKHGMLTGIGKSYTYDGHLYSTYLFDMHYMNQEHSYLEINACTNKSVFHFLENNNRWVTKPLHDSIVKSLVFPEQKLHKITIYSQLKRNFFIYFPPTLLFESVYCVTTGNNYGPIERTWFSDIIVNDSMRLQIKGKSFLQFDFFSDSLHFEIGNRYFTGRGNGKFDIKEEYELFFEVVFSNETKIFSIVQREKEFAKKEILSLHKKNKQQK